MKKILIFWLFFVNLLYGFPVAAYEAGFEAKKMQNESLRTIDINDPNDETLQIMAKASGMNPEEWKAEQEKTYEDILTKGFTEVDKKEIVNLSELYKAYKKELNVDLVDVVKKLSFTPLGNINDPSFRLIGAEAAGAVTEKGFSDLSLIYESPYGKIQIIESDMQSSQGVTFMPSFALNAKVGIYDASLMVKKANDSSTFETTICWYNFNQKREYTMLVNKNLNDKSLQQERDTLFKMLNTAYGG